jgi:transcriptional regulator
MVPVGSGFSSARNRRKEGNCLSRFAVRLCITLLVMYLPKSFIERDPERVRAFIEAHAFGVLIVPGDGGELEITHIPFLFDHDAKPSGRLRAHVARANPIWKRAIDAPAVTVVFAGPHGYVSPSWYEHRTEQVPTWNYMTVHARGRAEGPCDHDESMALLDDLASYYERGMPAPWSAAELDPAFREDLLREIVVFSIRIDRLDAKFKLSQNRSLEDRARVIRAFEERGRADDLEMAAAMTR